MTDEKRPNISRKQPSQPEQMRTFTVEDNSGTDELSNEDLLSKLNQINNIRNGSRNIINNNAAKMTGRQSLPDFILQNGDQQFEKEQHHVQQFNPDMSFEDQKKIYEQNKVKEKISNISLKLERLLSSTKFTKRIDVTDSLFFTLKNLSSEEQKQSILSGLSAEKYEIESKFLIKDHLIAFSIQDVSGMTIKDIFGEDTLDNRLLLVKKLDPTLADRLHKDVISFQEEVNSKIGIKSQEQVQELVEEIKKA